MLTTVENDSTEYNQIPIKEFLDQNNIKWMPINLIISDSWPEGTYKKTLKQYPETENMSRNIPSYKDFWENPDLINKRKNIYWLKNILKIV